MLLGMFSVFDDKAEAFLPPFFSQTPGTAERSFAAAARDASSDISVNTEDYTLYHFGWFESETGQFDLFDEPRSLATGEMLKAVS